MTVSIIIPVYNAEAYLRECIDSALAQTYTHMEVILVDDGSTDSSSAICDDYAAKHACVSVAHTANGGLSAARNVGLDMARGEYVVFLDSDDTLHPRAVEMMIVHASPTHIVNARMLRSASCTWHDYPHAKVRRYTPTAAIRSMLYQQGLNNSACGKMFPAHIFEKHRFTNGVWYEDLDIMYRLFESIGGEVVDIDAVLYFYRINPGSFINTFDRRRLDVLKVTDTIEAHYQHDPRLLRAARDRKFSAACNMFILTSRAGLEAEADACWQVVRRYRWGALTDPQVRLKNKAGALLSYLGRKAFLCAAR